MADSPVTVNRFSWPDLMPSLIIFRSLPTALSMTVLVLSLFAVAATPIGWIAMEKIFVSEDLNNDEAFREIAEVNRSPWKAVYPKWNQDDSLLTVLGNQLRGVELIFNTGVRSFQGVFTVGPGLGRFCYYLGGALWTLLIWCFFGCAITRTALMRYTRDEPIGIDDASDFAFDKFLSCFGGIGIPLLAVAGLTIPIALVGLIMTSNIGAAIGGVLWFGVLIPSLVIAVILLGLIFAWPLIVSAISCEGQDSFDGMSRAFAYVFQRPVHYVVYTVIAVLFTGVCWFVGSNLIGGTIKTAHWASSWGLNIADENRSMRLSDTNEIEIVPPLEEIETAEDVLEAAKREAILGRELGIQRDDESPDLITNSKANETDGNLADKKDAESSLSFARNMIKFWDNVARTLGAAFLYGLFWCVAASVYLLLRRDLDATATDEIYLVDERRTYELPPLKDDESGVPQVDEDAVLPAKVEPPSADESSDED